MNFTFSKYSGVAAAGTWTLDWIRVANLATEHLIASDSLGARLNLFISVLGIGFGCLMTIRFYPRHPDLYSTKPTPPEPWYRQVKGWFGAMVWCLVGWLWNMGIYKVLMQSAIKGQTANFIILIPFSLIGLLFLMLLFVSLAFVLDFVFQLRDEAPSSAAVPSTMEPPPSPPVVPAPSPKPDESAPESSFKKAPILSTLEVISFVNWFVCFGISLYLGGDALGILPSRDGFIVTSHGRHTPVTESEWVFSLYYAAATTLGTPLIWLLYAARTMGGKFKTAKWTMKLFIVVFLTVWIIGWFSSIGSSFYRSLNDWQKMKQNGLQPSRQTPVAGANM